MMARALEDAIEQALGYMGEYIGLAPDSGGEVEVNKDFGVASMRGDLQQLIIARAARDISQQTLLDEMVRRDYLGPAFDMDTNAAQLAAEPPQQNGAPMDLGPAAPAIDPKAPVPGAV
jgi:hypothetical protein